MSYSITGSPPASATVTKCWTQAGLRRLVVVRGDDQRAVRTGGRRLTGQPHRGLGVVVAHPGNHTGPVAHRLQHRGEQSPVLVGIGGGRFTGRAADHQPVAAGVDQDGWPPSVRCRDPALRRRRNGVTMAVSTRPNGAAVVASGEVISERLTPPSGAREREGTTIQSAALLQVADPAHSFLPGSVQGFARNVLHNDRRHDWRFDAADSERARRDEMTAWAAPDPSAWNPPAEAAWVPPTWEEIVRDHSARVFRLAYRLTGNPHDAEDLTQDVFVRVFRSLHRFQPGTFEGWLHRITTNLFLDSARRKQKIRFDGLAEGSADRLPSRLPVTVGAVGRRGSRPRRGRGPRVAAPGVPCCRRALRHRGAELRGDRCRPRGQDRHHSQPDPPRPSPAADRAGPSTPNG